MSSNNTKYYCCLRDNFTTITKNINNNSESSQAHAYSTLIKTKGKGGKRTKLKNLHLNTNN
tara:strand:+ start:301 stop:483 length:183 start_codon:yes stop_codon:yes gene_type:complete